MKLKKLKEQVIVITGATSGIGLVTARMAAQEGARLVLAARNQEALKELSRELSQAECVPANVANEEQLRRVADHAIEKFGHFDTWVNNAGVSIYGPLMDVPIEDQRRLFETNYWGTVIGSKIAVEHLRRKGGALINIGSVLSDVSMPLQGAYSASKHAVQGFTDALRMEIEKEGAPISITLIKPTSIDTPYRDHAKNYLGTEPENPPPVYAPDIVAKAILFCVQHQRRDVFVGSGGKLLSLSGKYAPRLTDKMMQASVFDIERSGKPPKTQDDSLYGPSKDLAERGGYDGMVRETSLYTKASLHPALTGMMAIGGGLAIAAYMKSSRRQKAHSETYNSPSRKSQNT